MRANELLDTVRQLLREADGRRGQIPPADVRAFEGRIESLREIAAATMRRHADEIEQHECELDTVREALNELNELEQVVLDGEGASC